MTKEEYYGDALSRLKTAQAFLERLVEDYPSPSPLGDVQPILYYRSRIKEPDSMIRKLKKQGLPTDSGTALRDVHDALGIRVVCSFMEDVYAVAQWLERGNWFTITERKDYIASPKPNGYRSLHLIARFPDGLLAEIQLRTIALDFWAALEHQMKYKREVRHEAVIRGELKRCADEIASIDISMQTLRELIQKSNWPV